MNIFRFALSFSGFSIPLVTEIFILIDSGIFAIATAALKGFYEILEVSYKVFGAQSSNGYGFDLVKVLIGRVMVLAGVYALFRIALMLISYAIDPSKLKSAEKTGRDIVKNAFIAIILLILSPFIFEKLGEFQYLVFENEVIENIIYGKDGSGLEIKDEETDESVKAKKFTNNMWLLFFTAKNDAPSTGECIVTYDKVKKGEGNILSLIGCHYKYYNYLPIAPLIVGVMLIYYFLMYSFELGARMLKLLVLEMISPIPIIMSIDPSQKNRLNNFVKAYIPIYLQIFVRVIMFYLAFAIAFLVLNNAGTILDNGSDISWFLKIVIIIGIFQGMKELPKLLEQALGFKLGMSNAKGSFGGTVKSIIGGTAGLVGGGIAGAVTGGVGGAVAGAASGMFKTAGALAGSKNVGTGIAKSISSIGSSAALGKNIRAGGGLFPFMGGYAANMVGGQGRDKRKLDSFDKTINDANTGMSNINKAADLRDKLNETVGYQFDRKHGSLDERLAGNSQYQEMLWHQKNPDPSAPRSFENDMATQSIIDNMRQNITNQYNSERDAYFDSQVRLASSGGANLDEDTRAIKQSLDSYHSFVESSGLSDRRVTSHTDLDRLKNSDSTELSNYQSQIRQANRDKDNYTHTKGFKARKAASNGGKK